MQPRFPDEPVAKRAALLAAVDGVRETLVQCAAESEAGATLAPTAVAALDQAGLFTLKLPRELGGAEADPLTQIEVIEAVSAIEPSAGWCVMIGATGLALPGAFLAQDAIATMFPDGRIPRGAVVAMPAGEAVRVAGGYRLSGRWPFASGVRHAQWITLGARVPAAGGEPAGLRFVVLPVSAVKIHDNWDVAGLNGTGSCDVSAEQLLVPDAFTWDRETAQPQRGGPLYRMPNPGFVANEHAAFAVGLARCALDTAMEMARSRRRGFTASASSLEGRAAFQRAIGLGSIRVKAARAHLMDVYGEAWAMLATGGAPQLHMHAQMRAAATYATEVAAEVTTEMFRYAGGAAVYRSQKLQRLLRDVNVAAQHLMVSDIAYETLGQFALGLPDPDPMR
jgi:alkylation response protein AidB-like acyl-CoA dehydrogenase